MTQDLLNRAVDGLIGKPISVEDAAELSEQFRNCTRLMKVLDALLILGAISGDPMKSIYAVLHFGYMVGREVEQLEQLERMTK